VDAKP
jgi:hypothetical protein